MSTEPQPESSTSPYGPAGDEKSDLEAAFGELPESAESTPTAAPVAPVNAPVPEVAWVARGRRVLRVSALVTGALSLAVLVVLLVLGAVGEGVLSSGDSEIGYTIVWFATLASPILFVIAMNLLIWRALLRPLSRKGRTEAIVLVIVTVIGLAVGSVVTVVLLMLAGFFMTAVLA